MQFDEVFKECPCIAILRGITADEINPVTDAFFDGGIKLLEITLNSPDPFTTIKKAVEHNSDRMLIGAGTVLTVREVQQVHEAGGRFIISPNTNVDVIRETIRLGMVSIPGFFTPTEAFTALEAGANYLKFFPAGSVGPSYVKDLKAVVKAPILAVGGVNTDNLEDFMAVCDGVGIGSAFYKPGKALVAITRNVRAYLRRIKRKK